MVLGIASCAQEEFPAALWEAQHPPTTVDVDASTPPPGTCRQAAAQPLPQRLVAETASAAGQSSAVHVSDLFNSGFVPNCGKCHGPAAEGNGLGNFHIASPAEFQIKMTPVVLGHIVSNGPTDPNDPLDPNDPKDPMPPFSDNGRPFNQRSASDPIVQFAGLVQQWLAAGSPSVFVPGSGDAGAGADAGDTASLSMSKAIGDSMTNLGNCVPDRALVDVASEPGPEHDRAAQLDALFANAVALPPGPNVSLAQMIGLPEKLSETDLFSYDAAVLAQHRTVAFQPAYPLWTDDAGKLRYVRVPLGKSIHFDKTTQEFDIPDNTRFYKTFMRRIADADGSYRWRKIETRVIVVRHDTTAPDGAITQNAIYGTYRWNDSESDATLVETLLNDALPFGDTLFLYNIDEQLAADVLSSNPTNTDLALLTYKAARHYAIPSSKRCVQCHQGSPSQSFILGFRPVQINRRPYGQGGTLVEPGQGPPGPDEMTQLQRLVDYGIITGVDSTSDILPLEQTEGARAPRNYQELTAQGYMLGNCSHCHNPRGYPSVTFPVLAPVLNFLPSPSGGIFQFPLEKYSPRITRGVGGSVQIPYATPSLMDITGFNSHYVTDGVITAYAPWRSLIFRNVDNPFTYVSDAALYPHMPMNSPGFDCRAKQIMSDWMVSIPAVRKNPQLSEYPEADSSSQPYVEVPPGDPRYPDAVRAAQKRLAILHAGVNPDVSGASPTFAYSRYADCPDNSDILDPAVVRDPTCHPVPTPPSTAQDGPIDNGVPTPVVAELAVPEHAHWVNTDLTSPQGPWGPRRADWATILVSHQFPPPSNACNGTASDSGQGVVPLIESARLSDVQSFATTPFPMGVWQSQSTCSASAFAAHKQKTVSQYSATDPGTGWMFNNPGTPPKPTDVVYSEVPGAAIFNMICINCHGPLADGTGRLADNLATMTGGGSIVADLRDGLFGPIGDPGANRRAPFSALPQDASSLWTSATIDERAARYMAWMGLGGTEVVIPQPILTVVANTQVLGLPHRIDPSDLSANMLAVAASLCRSLVEVTGNDGSTVGGVPWYPALDGVVNALIPQNGDAELWQHLCTFGNPPAVRAVDGLGNVYGVRDLFPESAFVCPANADCSGASDGRCPPGGPCPLGNHLGTLQQNGLDPSNLRPWCLRKSWHSHSGAPPPDPSSQDNPPKPLGKTDWPYCPSYIDDGVNFKLDDPNAFTTDMAQQWANRGAINAGFSVFLYLDGLAQGTVERLPDYTQCQLLQ